MKKVKKFQVAKGFRLFFLKDKGGNCILVLWGHKDDSEKKKWSNGDDKFIFPSGNITVAENVFSLFLFMFDVKWRDITENYQDLAWVIEFV